MTDFRLVWGLHAHSGGTVPDLHRIHYSLMQPEAVCTALERILNSYIGYSFWAHLSRENASLLSNAVDNLPVTQ